MEVTGTSAKIRLPNGSYQISFIDPVTLKVLQADEIQSKNLGKLYDLQIPDFTDDLVVKIENTIHQERTIIKGTE
jgi:hypothetical protein